VVEPYQWFSFWTGTVRGGCGHRAMHGEGRGLCTGWDLGTWKGLRWA